MKRARKKKTEAPSFPPTLPVLVKVLHLLEPLAPHEREQVLNAAGVFLGVFP